MWSARALVLCAALLCACGGAATEGAPAAPGDGAAPAGPAGQPAGPVVAAAAAAAPTASVNGIAVSAKDDKFTRVTVTFKNPGGVPCKIKSYTLVWPGGKKTIPLDNFIVGPGAAEIRATRIHATDGDITTLVVPSETHVELESDCK